jgi:glutamyl-tRNA synthetase
MRFAPSPTGSLHVGGARTALYNWLVARQAQNGKFLLRIEDTDLARSTRESEESMLADLEWLGLDWDEGPRVGGPCISYRQSERSQIYKEAADFLVRAGHAYPCFCTEEELESKRIAAKLAGSHIAYDGTWRDAPSEEVRPLLAAKIPHTYRFRTPPGKVVSVDDKVRGHVEWDVQATIGDFILLRSNGVPVYNFCVAVDDALMGISTVVRAEEHLTNTVRQLLVLEALGFEQPSYAHASLILGRDKSKLSKRHGATSCGQFRERGYLPDAMVNYLALLGWNDGTDKEVYSRQDLIKAFDLSRVTASPAMFDDAKLRWLNGQHLRAMSINELVPLVTEYYRASGLLQDNMDSSPSVTAFITAAASATQSKAELVTDIVELTRATLTYPLLETIGAREISNGTKVVPTKGIKKVLDDDFVAFSLALVDSYDALEAPAFCYNSALAATANTTTVLAWLQGIGDALNRSKKSLLMSARLALTGKVSGIDVPSQLKIIQCATHAGCSGESIVSIAQRIATLRAYVANAPDYLEYAAAGSASSSVSPPKRPDLDTFSKLRQVYESNRRTASDDAEMFEILCAAYGAL